MQDPENLILGTVHKSYKLYFLGGWGGGFVSGVLSRHSYFFRPSLCMNSCISIFVRVFLARTGMDCTVGGVCVCVCVQRRRKLNCIGKVKTTPMWVCPDHFH